MVPATLASKEHTEFKQHCSFSKDTHTVTASPSYPILNLQKKISETEEYNHNSVPSLNI